METRIMSTSFATGRRQTIPVMKWKNLKLVRGFIFPVDVLSER